MIRLPSRISIARPPLASGRRAAACSARCPSRRRNLTRCSRLDANSKFAIDADHRFGRARLGLPSDAAARPRCCEGIVKTRATASRSSRRSAISFARLKLAQNTLGPVGDEELEAAATVLKVGAKPAQLAGIPERAKGTQATSRPSRSGPTSSLAAFRAKTPSPRSASSGGTARTMPPSTACGTNVQADISQGLNPGAALQNRIREAPGRAPSKPTPPEGQQENQSSR